MFLSPHSPEIEPRHERSRLLIGALLLAGVAAVCAPLSPVHAQQSGNCAPAAEPQKKKSPFSKRFGRLMGAAGVAAVTGRKASATAAADAAARDVRDTAREQAQADIAAAASCAGQQSAPAAAGAPAGAAAAPAGGYSRPGEIPVPAEAKAAKSAFDEFGKVRCSDCEGAMPMTAGPAWLSQASFAAKMAAGRRSSAR